MLLVTAVYFARSRVLKNYVFFILLPGACKAFLAIPVFEFIAGEKSNMLIHDKKTVNCFHSQTPSAVYPEG